MTVASIAERLSKFTGKSRTDQSETPRTESRPTGFLSSLDGGLYFTPSGGFASPPSREVLEALQAEKNKEDAQNARRARRTGRRSTIFGGLTAGEGLSPGASLSRRSLIAS